MPKERVKNKIMQEKAIGLGMALGIAIGLFVGVVIGGFTEKLPLCVTFFPTVGAIIGVSSGKSVQMLKRKLIVNNILFFTVIFLVMGLICFTIFLD